MSARYEDAEAKVVLIEPSRLRQAIPAHKPGEGAIGDCFRACIACLLGAENVEVVPHFTEQTMNENPKGGWQTTRLAREWLRDNTEWDMMTVSIDAARSYGVPYLLTVRSKTGPWPHCVVAWGDEVWWDPSGMDGYTLADAADATAEVLCTPYEPDPAEMVRQWSLATIVELEGERDRLRK